MSRTSITKIQFTLRVMHADLSINERCSVIKKGVGGGITHLQKVSTQVSPAVCAG